MSVMMKCGCAAAGRLRRRGGVEIDPPIPYCGIHQCDEQMNVPPKLHGRTARCGCGSEKPSSPDLAFFEFLGPGSREAAVKCECGYHKIAHDIPERAARLKCKSFKLRGPNEFDRFYCGCRGWD